MTSQSSSPRRIIVTGGLGFIGSAVVRRLIEHTEHDVLNVDVMTYAATTGSVESVAGSDRYQHEPVDITDGKELKRVFTDFAPDGVIHLAAESHVDRSIDGPGAFIHTNVIGTFELLQAARAESERRGGSDLVRFMHVSTDEVFGALAPGDPAFDEQTAYDPRSPYSASKASSDHLVRAWHETFNLPTIITNCSNNYGPFHFPEKLIPLMIVKGLAGEPLPVYGTGDNVRDWLFVDDHARAIIAAFESGTPGETYAVGGNAERTNLEVVHGVCDLLDELAPPLESGEPRRSLISFVTDRPGHDLRYAVNASKAKAELAWEPSLTFEEGLRSTIEWYLANEQWWRPIHEQSYAGQRLGTSESPGKAE